MILLGIDTCGAEGSVALARLEVGSLTRLGEAALPGRTTAAGLVPAIEELLTASDVSAAHGGLSGVEALVVVDGPGSFTGIRIGLSAAKAFAEALGLPLFAVSRLAVLMAKAQARAAVLDAGREECYYLAPDGEESLIAWDELVSRAAETPTAACETALAGRVAGLHMVAAPTALDAIAAVVPAIEAGERADVATLDGRYLRRSDLYKLAAPGRPA